MAPACESRCARIGSSGTGIIAMIAAHANQEMNMSFQISPLNAGEFDYLHTLSAGQLAEQNIVVRVADSNEGYPCRVSLQDANIGDELFLFNYEHLPVDSPYRSTHAIYVKKNAVTANPQQNEVPSSLRTRLIAVRGFDRDGIMLEADVCEGSDLESGIHAAFRNPAVDYIHLHYAKAGCFAARVNRV